MNQKKKLEKETNKKTRHKRNGSKAQGGGLRIQERIPTASRNSKTNCHGHNSYKRKVRNTREKLRRRGRSSKVLPKGKIATIVCSDALE
jgi:hypothetical protein